MLILGTVVLLLATLLLLFYGMKMKMLEKENRLLVAYMDTAREFYQETQKRVEASRRYRHDLAKHIQTLEKLLAERLDEGEVRTYMEGLKKEYAGLKKKNFCRDEILESILDTKADQCRELGIPIEISVEDCFYSEIEEVDMVGLLCNLLDNAIEASPKGSTIFLSSKKQGDFLELTVSNPAPPLSNTEFMALFGKGVTTKASRDGHGFGLYNILRMTERYHGKILTRNESILNENYVVFGILMP